MDEQAAFAIGPLDGEHILIIRGKDIRRVDPDAAATEAVGQLHGIDLGRDPSGGRYLHLPGRDRLAVHHKGNHLAGSRSAVPCNHSLNMRRMGIPHERRYSHALNRPIWGSDVGLGMQHQRDLARHGHLREARRHVGFLQVTEKVNFDGRVLAFSNRSDCGSQYGKASARISGQDAFERGSQDARILCRLRQHVNLRTQLEHLGPVARIAARQHRQRSAPGVS